MCYFCAKLHDFKKIMKKDLNINNNRREGDLKSLPLAECQFESGRGHH